MPSTSLRARSPKAAHATPKNSENTTIWRISLVAIASTIERGTRCATNSFIDSEVTFRLVAACASGSGRLRLSPGRSTLDENHSQQQRNQRSRDEPDHCLRANATDRFGVTPMRHAHDKGRE